MRVDTPNDDGLEDHASASGPQDHVWWCKPIWGEDPRLIAVSRVAVEATERSIMLWSDEPSYVMDYPLERSRFVAQGQALVLFVDGRSEAALLPDDDAARSALLRLSTSLTSAEIDAFRLVSGLGDVDRYTCQKCGELEHVATAAIWLRRHLANSGISTDQWLALAADVQDGLVVEADVARACGTDARGAAGVMGALARRGLLTFGPEGPRFALGKCSGCAVGDSLEGDFAEKGIFKEQKPEQAHRHGPDLSPSVAARTRFEVLRRDGFACVYCGRTARAGVVLHIDHYQPRSLGGSNDIDNLVTSCRECNLGKGASPPP